MELQRAAEIEVSNFGILVDVRMNAHLSESDAVAVDVEVGRLFVGKEQLQDMFEADFTQPRPPCGLLMPNQQSRHGQPKEDDEDPGNELHGGRREVGGKKEEGRSGQ